MRLGHLKDKVCNVKSRDLQGNRSNFIEEKIYKMRRDKSTKENI